MLVVHEELHTVHSYTVHWMGWNVCSRSLRGCLAAVQGCGVQQQHTQRSTALMHVLIAIAYSPLMMFNGEIAQFLACLHKQTWYNN